MTKTIEIKIVPKWWVGLYLNTLLLFMQTFNLDLEDYDPTWLVENGFNIEV